MIRMQPLVYRSERIHQFRPAGSNLMTCFFFSVSSNSLSKFICWNFSPRALTLILCINKKSPLVRSALEEQTGFPNAAAMAPDVSLCRGLAAGAPGQGSRSAGPRGDTAQTGGPQSPPSPFRRSCHPAHGREFAKFRHFHLCQMSSKPKWLLIP